MKIVKKFRPSTIMNLGKDYKLRMNQPIGGKRYYNPKQGLYLAKVLDVRNYKLKEGEAATFIRFQLIDEQVNDLNVTTMIPLATKTSSQRDKTLRALFLNSAFKVWDETDVFKFVGKVCILEVKFLSVNSYQYIKRYLIHPVDYPRNHIITREDLEIGEAIAHEYFSSGDKQGECRLLDVVHDQDKDCLDFIFKCWWGPELKIHYTIELNQKSEEQDLLYQDFLLKLLKATFVLDEMVNGATHRDYESCKNIVFWLSYIHDENGFPKIINMERIYGPKELI